MKLIKMTATFGNLNGATLELGGGLNIITAPNEGGKSTWCAFLRAMLYGIPTRERDTKTVLAEKNRYQPWSGAPMEGTIQLLWGGKELTIRRFQRGASPFGGFEAVYTATGEPVPGMTGENAGELLLGVSREVFQRTAFVGQSGVPIDGDPELERRIASLVSSGEEDISFTQAETALKTWQRRRKYNKSGLIPSLEEEKTELEARLGQMGESIRRLEEARVQQEELAKQKALLEAEQAAQKARTAWFQREQYQGAVSELEAAQKEVATLEAEAGPIPSKETLRQAQGELAYYNTLAINLREAQAQSDPARQGLEEAQRRAVDPVFPDMKADKARQKAWEDAEDVKTHRSKEHSRLNYLPVIIGILVGFLLSQFPIVQGQQRLLMAAVGTVATVLLLWIPCSLLRAKHRKAARTILDRYSAQLPEDIIARAESYAALCEEADGARRNLAALETSLADMQRQREELLHKLLDLVHDFAPTVKDVFGISAALSRALSMDERLATARVKAEGARKLVSSVPAVSVTQAPATPPPASPHTPPQTAASLAAVSAELNRVSADLAMALGARNTMGDPALLEPRLEELKEALAQRRTEYQAIGLAHEVLSEANAELRARFSPDLNRRAGEILSALTGGKYADVTLTREFEAAAREEGGVLPRSRLSLSRGTVDQLYLAVRLAVCEAALPSEDPAPLVLDEALADFDDSRAAMAVHFLCGLGEARQILLFTCHSRESGLIGDNSEAVSITLS